MARYLLVFALVVAWIYTLITVIRTPGRDMRLLPKWLWLVLVILVIGLPMYWLLGRPLIKPFGGGNPARRAPRAPDDDPAFLNELGKKAWQERMKKRRGDGGPRPA